MTSEHVERLQVLAATPTTSAVARRHVTSVLDLDGGAHDGDLDLLLPVLRSDAVVRASEGHRPARVSAFGTNRVPLARPLRSHLASVSVIRLHDGPCQQIASFANELTVFTDDGVGTAFSRMCWRSSSIAWMHLGEDGSLIRAARSASC